MKFEFHQFNSLDELGEVIIREAKRSFDLHASYGTPVVSSSQFHEMSKAHRPSVTFGYNGNRVTVNIGHADYIAPGWVMTQRGTPADR